MAKKTITFRDDYANTEKYVQKYMVKAVAKTFRDFPCLDKVKIVIPSKELGKTYYCEITKQEAAEFFALDFDVMKTDIRLFRMSFLENSRFDDYFHTNFADKFIKTK